MQSNNITSILGLPEFNVIPMVETNESVYLRIEKGSTVETCPTYGSEASAVHDRRKQPIKGLSS